MKTILLLFVLIIKIFSPINVLAVSSANNTKINITPHQLQTAIFYEEYVVVGRASMQNSSDYFAKVRGVVDEVSKIQGSMVQKGDVLLIIDKKVAEKLKARAEANLYLAESNYRGNSSLLKKNIINKEEINRSKLLLENARSDYAKSIEIYDHMVIKAEEDGYIGVIRANVASDVKEGDYLFSIINKSNFNIFVELPEKLRGRILRTDSVSIECENGDIINGNISAISDYLSNHGTITAKLQFPFNENLIHGSYVSTNIIFNKHTGLAVPEKAILKNNNGNFVYMVTKDNKIKQIFITPGIRTNNMIELLSNELVDGDMIVLEGLTKVYDGLEVEVNSQ